jgi:hypothetical protein
MPHVDPAGSRGVWTSSFVMGLGGVMAIAGATALTGG